MRVTRVLGVLGASVGHSLSPRMQSAAFAHLAMDAVYLPFDIAPGALARALYGAQALGLWGLNVTAPHKERADGIVTATKPLSHQGTMIEGIQVRFEKGRIVEARATRGQEVLERLIATDDGARRLGEVALVPHSSPIAQSGLVFLNTLFDENAASHIALGQSYSSCLRDGEKLSAEALAAKGANESLIHVDWMIGSGELDIDGITASGAVEPLMRGGEWACTV